MSEIEWRDIPGYPGYQVSSTGLVRRSTNSDRLKAGSILASPLLNGYPSTSLSINDVRKRMHIHRVMMLAFVGKCPADIVVNHKNGIKTDNRLDNLEYVTISYNTKHAYDHLGVSKAGAKNGRAKLNDTLVREIRQQHKEGAPIRAIAAMYHVSHSTISEIIHRKKWGHVA